jgi:GNAT superfamily N-acetyltransferase
MSLFFEEPVPYSVRPATTADINSLAKLLVFGFYAEVNQSILSSWLYPLLCWSIRLDLASKLTEKSVDSICLVAADQNSKQAIATIELHFRKIGSFWSTSVKSAYLSSLAVDPNFRRNGIASLLIENAEIIAKEKGYVEMYLHVIKENKPARQLYQKLNYCLSKSESNFATRLLGFPNRLLLHKYLK